jgi:hypothetical protein
MREDGHARDERSGPGWPASTRGGFLAAGAALGAALLGEGPGSLLRLPEALAAKPETTPALHRFVTRPDLKPPLTSITLGPGRRGAGLLFLAPSSGPGQRGALIVDDEGEVVWFRPSTPDTTMDFRAGFYKGKPVMTWWEGRHHEGVGLRGSYVVADASYREIARFISRDQLKPDFHECLLTPYDTLLVTSYDPAPADLSPVGGPRRGSVYEGVVRELEIPTGRVLFEWRSLPHVAVAETYQTEMGKNFDYFHVNSIGFDSDGNLLVSARNTWTVYKIDRRSGDVIWRLGGKRSDFAMGPGTQFAFQHDARSHEHGTLISLFDNGPVPKTKPRSRGIVIALDHERMRARLARQHIHSPALFARATGNVQVLPNGNTFVCWGITGAFTEYGPDGKVRLDGKLPEGGQNYRVFRLPWTGAPKDAPRLAAQPDSLYASWNGSTETRAWQVRAGAISSSLPVVSTVPRKGFETALPRPDAARFAQVVALDGRGRPLGRSRVVEL